MDNQNSRVPIADAEQSAWEKTMSKIDQLGNAFTQRLINGGPVDDKFIEHINNILAQ